MSWSMAWACDRPAGCPTRRSSRPLGRGVRVLRGSVDAELLSRVADEAVEAFAVLAVDALLELGVDVEGHLAVGVADLAHHPLDVEVVGEQRDRDVGAPESVRSCAWQWRKATLDSLRAGCLGGVVDELADAQAAAGEELDRRSAANIGRAPGAQPCEVKTDRRLGQLKLGGDLAERAASGGSSRDPGARGLAGQLLARDLRRGVLRRRRRRAGRRARRARGTRARAWAPGCACRFPRAGLRSISSSSIASSSTIANTPITLRAEKADSGTTRRLRASRRSAPAAIAARSSAASRSICALNSRHSRRSI